MKRIANTWLLSRCLWLSLTACFLACAPDPGAVPEESPLSARATPSAEQRAASASAAAPGFTTDAPSSTLAESGHAMLAYYKFDEGGINIAQGNDFSGNGQTATPHTSNVLYYGGRWASSFGARGCYTADGNYFSTNIGNKFELLALVCPRQLRANGTLIVGREGMFSLTLTAAGNVQAELTDETGLTHTLVGSTAAVAQDPSCEWQQVGASYDGSVLSVWYNGRLDGTLTVGRRLSHPSGGYLYLGGKCSCGTEACITNGLSGYLDDVKISKGNGACSQAPTTTRAVNYPGQCSGWYDGRSYDVRSSEPMIDNDADGIDDCLEEELLDSWAMNIWSDAADGCPGPSAPHARVCRTWLTGASGWTSAGTLRSFNRVHPSLSCALLYQKDCGAAGHTADVEPYQLAFTYSGASPDGLPNGPGSRSDRNLTHWTQRSATTEAHYGTVAEHDNTCTTGNCVNVLASRDKHGNYQSAGNCNNWDSCGTMALQTNFRNLDAGEPAASRVPDLGTAWPSWAGWSPWDSRDFLLGGAGKISDKLNLAPLSDAPLASYNGCFENCTLARTCCQRAGGTSTACNTSLGACISACGHVP